MTKDWTGNSRSCHATLGARNYALEEREVNDYYATEPKALELLLDKNEIDFNHNIWECACGELHLSNVLKRRGYNVRNSDKFDRLHNNEIEVLDFLTCHEKWSGDIVTNPPYKYAKEFVEKALGIITQGNKVAMFLKLQFLESKKRRELFEKYPPKYVYVSTSRLCCAMNGDFEKYSKSNAVTYCWIIWEKGFTGEPVIRWFN